MRVQWHVWGVVCVLLGMGLPTFNYIPNHTRFSEFLLANQNAHFTADVERDLTGWLSGISLDCHRHLSDPSIFACTPHQLNDSQKPKCKISMGFSMRRKMALLKTLNDVVSCCYLHQHFLSRDLELGGVPAVSPSSKKFFRFQ